MALGIQIVGLIFAAIMLYLTYLHFKRKEFTPKESIAWIGMWIVFIVLIFLPASVEYIAVDILSFSRIFDFFIVLGLMFLVGSGFYTYGLVRSNQKRIEVVVRKVALEQKEQKK